MMKRDDCLKALARHVVEADIVLPVYSTAFDWIAIRPSPLNYLSHGAMASPHRTGLAWRSGGRTSGSSCSTATAAC